MIFERARDIGFLVFLEEGDNLPYTPRDIW